MLCCDGTCYDPQTQGCCDGKTVYNKSTKKCCWEGTGHTCPKSPVDMACCDGNCCDPNECETCDYINGGCEVCYGDTSKTCCNGTCEPKCGIVDGENCNGSDDELCNLTNCAVEPGHPCQSGPARKVYEGGTEKICSPRGCEGDCIDDRKDCYTVYKCIGSSSYEWMSTCSSMYCLPGANCWPKGYFSCESNVPIPTKCYGCEQGPEDVNESHDVDNDSCGG